MFAVIALMVGHAGFGEDMRRGTEHGTDTSLRRSIVPSEIERGVFLNKDHPRVGQFVVNEPGQRVPVLRLLV